MSSINLCGEFVTHKAFGRGQITGNEDGVITVMFSDTKEIRKFIFPSAIENFLMLENDATVKEYKVYSDGIADEKAMARKDAADRLEIEKQAVKDHAKALKKAAQKKPAKKAKAKVEFDFVNDNDR